MSKQEPHMSFTQEQILRAVKGWCFDCGQPAPPYMVHTELWSAAWPPNNPYSVKRKKALARVATALFPDRPRHPGNDKVIVHLHLCFGCLEKRIGRRLKITDFPVVSRQGLPMRENVGIFLGYMLGKRRGRLEAERSSKNNADSGDKKDEGG